MGNELSVAVPTVVQPIEAYLGELGPGYTFVASLGSTRFLKTGKVLKREGDLTEGWAVAKVLPVHEPTFSLRPYRDQLTAIRDRLAQGPQGSPNCAPAQIVKVSESCGVMVREFGRWTLAERLSTRPFLRDAEKRWLAFQLLQGLHQAHSLGISHGDVKPNNVILSSDGWLRLADFAPFKPAFLPLDNPADFTYFFDTSRKGHCYLAPERFCAAAKVPSSQQLLGAPSSASFLTAAMDVFAAGCVLVELFCDGQVGFHLGELLRSGQLLGAPSSASFLTAAMDVFAAGCVLVELFCDGQVGFHLGELLRSGQLLGAPSSASFLTAAMDVFAAGCVLVELFCDGQVGFHLGELLRSGQLLGAPSSASFLTAAMDVFAAGCVLVELFCDGQVGFHLGELLRSGQLLGAPSSASFLTAAMDVFTAGCVLVELFCDGQVGFHLGELLRSGQLLGAPSSASFLTAAMDVFTAGCVLVELFCDGQVGFHLGELLRSGQLLGAPSSASFLTAAMDVFAAGCVLVELFCDGQVGFHLGELLRSGQLLGAPSSASFLTAAMDVFTAGCVLVELFCDGQVGFHLGELLRSGQLLGAPSSASFLTAAMDVFTAGCVLVELFCDGQVGFHLGELLRSGQLLGAPSSASFLTAAMDVFTAGCVLVELFCDGQVGFHLGELLRSGQLLGAPSSASFLTAAMDVFTAGCVLVELFCDGQVGFHLGELLRSGQLLGAPSSASFLTAAMDVFTAGCVLVELFCDGQVGFHLGELLRSGQLLGAPSSASFLTAAMDVFTAGCVLVELFCDGQVGFHLGELLRSGQLLGAPSSASFLTAAMDVFTAGCVLVELFCDGQVGFHLGELLRSGQLLGAPSSASFLTAAMDVFAAGCVLVELFCDGQVGFHLGELLRYKEDRTAKGVVAAAGKGREAHLAAVLKHIAADAPLTALITDMLAVDPKKRPSAGELLSRYRESVFPPSFYDFHWAFHSDLVASLPRLTLEQRVARLDGEKERLLGLEPEAEGILALSILTASVRGLRGVKSKRLALRLLVAFGEKMSVLTVLDRILPYAAALLSDGSGRTRSEAVWAVEHLMSGLSSVPDSNRRIFPDYVLPKLAPLASDPSARVRVALATALPQLASTAQRFLDSAPPLSSDPDLAAPKAEDEAAARRRERARLTEGVQEVVVSLLCDQSNEVRRALVHAGLPELCAFLGKARAADVLLSHMITFLNDKRDWGLRASFFRCAPSVASFIGSSSTLILRPLLQQGLRDLEERVVEAALHCLASLAKLRLLQKPALYELLGDAVLFLAHPNEWLRSGTVAFVASLAQGLSMADVHCKVSPVLSAYLSQPLIQLSSPAVLLRALRPPIPRAVWDQVAQSPRMEDLLDFLNQKHFLRNLSAPKSLGVSDFLGDEGDLLGRERTSSREKDPEGDLGVLYRKLRNLGLEEGAEARLSAFATTLVKMQRIFIGREANHQWQSIQMRETLGADLSPSSPRGSRPGVVELSQLRTVRRHADLTFSLRRKSPTSLGNGAPILEAQTSAAVANEEWEAMFGSDSKPRTPSPAVPSPATPATPDPDDPNQPPPLPPQEEEDEVAKEISRAMSEAIEEAEVRDEVEPEAQPTVEVRQATPPQAAVDTSAADRVLVRSECGEALTELVEWKRREWAAMPGAYPPPPTAQPAQSFRSVGVLVRSECGEALTELVEWKRREWAAMPGAYPPPPTAQPAQSFRSVGVLVRSECGEALTELVEWKRREWAAMPGAYPPPPTAQPAQSFRSVGVLVRSECGEALTELVEWKRREWAAMPGAYPPPPTAQPAQSFRSVGVLVRSECGEALTELVEWKRREWAAMPGAYPPPPTAQPAQSFRSVGVLVRSECGEALTELVEWKRREWAAMPGAYPPPPTAQPAQSFRSVGVLVRSECGEALTELVEWKRREWAAMPGAYPPPPTAQPAQSFRSVGVLVRSECGEALTELVEWKRREWAAMPGAYPPPPTAQPAQSFRSVGVLVRSECGEALTELVEWKRREWAAMPGAYPPPPTAQPAQSFRPRGYLAGQLHEHKAGVTALFARADGRLFASASLDGSLRLWDSQRLEGRAHNNREKAVYSGLGERVRCGGFLGVGERLFAAADNARLHLLRTERLGGRQGSMEGGSGALEVELRTEAEGRMVECVGWGEASLLGLTHHGWLLHWDLRQGPVPVWRRRNASRDGLVTSAALDEAAQHWLCLGTSAGKAVLWDLRFQLPVATVEHPSGASSGGVVGVWASSSAERVWLSVGGNEEVAEWELETASMATALWPSPHAPLAYQQRSGLSTTALLRLPSGAVVTGSSEGALRSWLPGRPEASYPISLPRERAMPQGRLYQGHIVDGVEVQIESRESAEIQTSSGLTAGGPPNEVPVNTWHKDGITGLCAAHSGEQWFLLSASRDGVIKVWK